jgi:hypothetical protein
MLSTQTLILQQQAESANQKVLPAPPKFTTLVRQICAL